MTGDKQYGDYFVVDGHVIGTELHVRSNLVCREHIEACKKTIPELRDREFKIWTEKLWAVTYFDDEEGRDVTIYVDRREAEAVGPSAKPVTLFCWKTKR